MGAKPVPVAFSIVLKTVHMVGQSEASDDGSPKPCSKEQMMSPSQSVERSIIRQLLNRRAQPRAKVSVESLITTLSIVAGLGLLAVFVPGLLGALFVGAVVLTLGS